MYLERYNRIDVIFHFTNQDDDYYVTYPFCQSVQIAKKDREDIYFASLPVVETTPKGNDEMKVHIQYGGSKRSNYRNGRFFYHL